MKQNLQGLGTFQPFNCQLFFTIFLPSKAGIADAQMDEEKLEKKSAPPPPMDNNVFFSGDSGIQK